MHQIRFLDWGSSPDPAGGAYNAPPDLWLDLRGGTSKEGTGRKGERDGIGKELGKGGKGEGRGKLSPQRLLSGLVPELREP